MADLTGKTILHYKIIEQVGQGGMGVVYKAEDTKLERTVALKFLSHSLIGGEEEKARFKREAKAAAALNHPNIATIYAIEEAEDELFIVMEYIEGQELRGVIYGTVGVQNFEPLPID
ncbi:MAG: protein kinase, partial [bacterium]